MLYETADGFTIKRGYGSAYGSAYEVGLLGETRFVNLTLKGCVFINTHSEGDCYVSFSFCIIHYDFLSF